MSGHARQVDDDLDAGTSLRPDDDPVVGASTLPRMFEDSVARNATRTAQLYKGGIYDRSLAGGVVEPAPAGEYRSLTYEEMAEIVRNLAAGFRHLGVEPDARVAIFAETRMEWAQTDFAVLAAGGVVTTVYANSSVEKVRYLLEDPGAAAIVVENEALLERVLDAGVDLEFVVVLDEVADEYADREDVYTLAEVHDEGEARFDPDAYEDWLDSRQPDDLASLIYTSGTTGQPKGVRLTHRNFRANVNQCRRRFGPRPDRDDGVPVIDEETRTVSYLPLAHVFERLSGHFLIFACGGAVGYAESPDTLREDFGLLSPTVATSVPRVYEKMYDAIRSQAQESPIKARIFEWATAVGRSYHEADDPGIGLELRMKLADRLVFRTVRDALGGDVEMLISGGGSLSPDLCALYHAMGLPIFEGYGLTETSPVVCVNPPDDPKIGTIGPPLDGVDVRIDESVAPEETFDGGEGEVGELLVDGPNVTDGYWDDPDETAAAFTDDGFFRTGDIVRRRPDDYLVFHERAKQLLVLSTGKNVAPGPIEDAFAASDVVEQCMVIGDGRKFVSALVVPNVEGIRAWAAEEGIDLPEGDDALCRDDRIRERIQREIDRVNQRFEEYERIGRFRLVPTEFTEDNDLLTPTMKKKRRNVLERFADEVEEMYSE